jgi:hypothetical protein
VEPVVSEQGWREGKKKGEQRAEAKGRWAEAEGSE